MLTGVGRGSRHLFAPQATWRARALQHVKTAGQSYLDARYVLYALLHIFTTTSVLLIVLICRRGNCHRQVPQEVGGRTCPAGPFSTLPATACSNGTALLLPSPAVVTGRQWCSLIDPGPSPLRPPDLRCLLKTKSFREPPQRNVSKCAGRKESRHEGHFLPRSAPKVARMRRADGTTGVSGGRQLPLLPPVGGCRWESSSMTQGSGFGFFWLLKQSVSCLLQHG